MPKKSYYELLRDPRWQRRRLEIMHRAGFLCESCGTGEETLNVHHKIYRKGAMPWDYADGELACLCEDCHETEHEWRRRLNEVLAQGGDLLQVVGFAEALFTLARAHDEPDAELRISDIEHAIGAEAALKANGGSAYELLDQCRGSAQTGYTITAREFFALHARSGSR